MTAPISAGCQVGPKGSARFRRAHRWPKPAPDIFALALERAGVEASDAFVVGDTELDGKAPAACGVRFLGVLSGGVSEGELREAGAVATYDDAAGVLAGLDDGPVAALLG